MVHVNCLNEPKVSAYNYWHLIVGDTASNLLYYKKIKYGRGRLTEDIDVSNLSYNIRTVSFTELHETVTLGPPKCTNREVTALLLNEEYSKRIWLSIFSALLTILHSKSDWMQKK
jgi:hypothetical protein